MRSSISCWKKPSLKILKIQMKMVIDESAATSRKRKRAYDWVLSVHEIDAQYLQRQLSSHYEDVSVCSELANDVLDILDISTEPVSELRECEDQLLVLLESELFDLIKSILNNWVRIWACVLLERAKDDAERDAIENVLKHEAMGGGMRALEETHSKSKAEDWTRDRMRGITDSFRNKRNESANKQEVSSALDSIGIKTGQDASSDKTEAKEEMIELD
jgi:pre-mRNA-splicing helicase BRR2